MFKPLTQTLFARSFGGSPMSPQLDPALVAQSLGVSYPVGQPLSENSIPVRHIEDDVSDSSLFLDELKIPSPKPATRSLYELAVTRLNSIKPRSKERAEQVAAMLGDLTQPFQAVDALVSVLESERSQALRDRWEELRLRGRALQSKIETELQANLNTAMMKVNAAEEKKGKISTRVQTSFQEVRAVLRNKFASEQEIHQAGARLAANKKASEAAALEALEAQRGLADAQNAMTVAKAAVLSIKTGMDQCSAELQGKPYHDPETGLSTDPVFYRQAW